MVQTIELVKRYLNPTLEIRGLVMTMYDSRTNLSRQVVEEVRRFFPGRVFRTIIPRNIRLSEAPSFGQPINLYAPSSSGAVAYQVLTTELLKGDGFPIKRTPPGSTSLYPMTNQQHHTQRSASRFRKRFS